MSYVMIARIAELEAENARLRRAILGAPSKEVVKSSDAGLPVTKTLPR